MISKYNYKYPMLKNKVSKFKSNIFSLNMAINLTRESSQTFFTNKLNKSPLKPKENAFKFGIILFQKLHLQIN